MRYCGDEIRAMHPGWTGHRAMVDRLATSLYVVHSFRLARSPIQPHACPSRKRRMSLLDIPFPDTTPRQRHLDQGVSQARCRSDLLPATKEARQRCCGGDLMAGATAACSPGSTIAASGTRTAISPPPFHCGEPLSRGFLVLFLRRPAGCAPRHREPYYRNVLLDATLTCKIGDFWGWPPRCGKTARSPSTSGPTSCLRCGGLHLW